jgi:hypothetical protein
MVAVWLPVLALFASFAIDVGHSFDYSRNLQNRADAAALAGGDEFGGSCFGSYTTTQTDAIGTAAQQYSGPPTGTPNANLPYTFGSAAPYQNQPTLTKGTPANYHVLLNSTKNWAASNGGTNWSMGTGAAQGNSLALCNSTDEDGNTGPMVDVRVTQADLGLFFSLPGLTPPTISAHARATLEGVAGENVVIPVAVRDPSAIQCVAVNYINKATGNPINPTPISMTPEGTDPVTGGTIWDVPAGTSIQIPAAGTGAGVFVQVVTGNCGANPQTYEPDKTGLLFVNSWSTAASPASPVITNGGVTLTGICSPNDNLSNQYFTDEPCNTVGVTANVLFPAGSTNLNVTAKDTLTNATANLVQTAGTNQWTTPNNKLFTIDPNAAPGEHPFDISVTYRNGGNNNADLGVQQYAFAACNEEVVTTCPQGQGNRPYGISGPIVLNQVRLVGDASGLPSPHTGIYGKNAFPAGSTQSLVLTLEIAGLSNSKPGANPTILRFDESGNGGFVSHATGLINCGQVSQGTKQAIQAIIGGCPVAGSSGANGCPASSNNFYFCAPLAINHRNGACPLSGNTGQAGSQIPPATTPTYRTANNPAVPVDCIGVVGGNKSPIPQGVACRIFTNISLDTCATGNPNNTICSANNWSQTIGAASVPGNDPRAITMVITAPEDLSGNSGPPIPIRNFAVFYVVGWNLQGGVPSCDGYGAVAPSAAPDAEHYNQCTDGTAPPSGCKTNGQNQNGGAQGEIWGYWIKYTDPGGIPSGTICKASVFGNCTPALTR